MSGIIGNHEVAQAEGEVYTFGAYEVSLADWELRKHGVKIRLSRQGFRVLAELLEATGKVVTREHLCKTLWPDDTHVSFETNLNSIVHDVREALGDTAKNPRFIETVAGRGYRFLAPVRGAGGEPRAPTRRWLYVVLAGLGVAAVLWSVSLVVRKPAPSIQNAPRISPFTSFAGEEQHPSFSPDGERVAFSWNGSHHGASNIYIKSTGTEEVEQLTDSPAQDINPEWSPDGERIAWARAGSNYTADIMTVAVTGGSEIRIKTIPSSEPTLSWSPDGKWIAYSVAYPDYVRRDTAAAIFAVELETGRTVQLTEPGPRTIADLDPAISPDGRMLAFVRVTSWGAGDLYVAGLDRDLKVTDKPRRITFGGINAASPSWTPDSKEIIFTAPRAGVTSLWTVSVAGAAGNVPVALGGRGVSSPSVSPSGNRVVFAVSSANTNLWRFEIRKPGGAPTAPVQLTHSTKSEGTPSISPDGSRIAFASNSTGNYEIWIANADATRQQRLTSFGESEAGTPRWSPDAGFLCFDSRVEGQGEIFTVDVESRKMRRVTVNPADDIVPSWSVDGKWIYFGSNRSGAYQIWKKPAEGGGAVQLTRGGGFHALESPGGKSLFYVKRQFDTEIWKVPVEGGEESLVAGILDYWQNFSVSRNGVFFTSRLEGGKTAIRVYEPATGETRRVTIIDAAPLSGLAVSRDGRTVVYSKPESTESDLAMMELRR